MMERVVKFYWQILLAVTLSAIFFSDCVFVGVEAQRVTYDFVRYPYRKKPKQERLYKVSLRQCERENCDQEQGLELLRCARKCVAPSCYQELYAHDELELGEIDVRASSFKGCWLKHHYS